ncbi:hypothetical protein TNCV_1224871 [Trichonephila clavipes]|nr:hypothetical protein TNCV_1224871 [Trichonephila clavipes]
MWTVAIMDMDHHGSDGSWIAQPHHEPLHNRFNLLRIIRCPLVPDDVAYSRVEVSAKRSLFHLPSTVT